MIKLKDILGEGGRMKYSRGEWHPQNDSSNGSPIKVTAWDTLVDEYNGKQGYSTSTKSDSRVYDSEIGNLSVGMEWKVSFRNNNWRYQLYKLGQLANIFRNLDELISHFKDNNGGNRVTEPIIGEGGTFGPRGKFYPGGPNNDEPFNFKDDKASRPTLPTPKEWDDLMDRVNNDPRFETYTGKDGYRIKDTNGPSSNLIWQLTPGRFGWSGIGRDSVEYPHPRQFNDVAELIKNFYEVTGLSAS